MFEILQYDRIFRITSYLHFVFLYSPIKKTKNKSLSLHPFSDRYMMGKQVRKATIFFFAFLIMVIIGNVVCVPAQHTDNTASVSCTTTYSEIQEPQSPMEKTIQHLFSQNHTDLPNKAIIIPNINTYDFKSVLRNVICLAVYYNITVYRSFACFNHPPTNKTISYYIYTLEKILI